MKAHDRIVTNEQGNKLRLWRQWWTVTEVTEGESVSGARMTWVTVERRGKVRRLCLHGHDWHLEAKR